MSGIFRLSTRQVVILLLMSLLWGMAFAWTSTAGWFRDQANGADTALQAGEYELRLESGRKYLLHVPASYDGTQPLPLLFFFHGGGGHMEHAAEHYGWCETAEREGFIVAFPNGSSVLPRGRLATWSAGECCGYARDNGVDEVAFVRGMIADIAAKVAIDKKRIFATGMSNGGTLAHRLACEMADIFTAVASVAGTDNTTVCTPARPISVMHIHALDDTHVLFNGGAGEDAFRDPAKVTDFTSVSETIARWVVRDGLDETPQRVLDIPGAHADLYTAKGSPAQVELVVTDNGGHSWPGGQSVRGNHPSQAIDANQVIWEFFVRQVRE